jgi:DNA repair protein SbcD/Mre11
VKQTIRFAHLADCHLGGWRDQRLRDIGMTYFRQAIDRCIAEDVDFIILAGDLFNTALPSFDILRETIATLQRVKDAGIAVYYIAGSHDYSSAGKTMLSLLDETRLAINVFKPAFVDANAEADGTQQSLMSLEFVVDKTGVQLCGIMGRSQGLEKSQFEILDRDALELPQGLKIFLFHTTVEELKPHTLTEVKGIPLSYFPKGFSYYAGGHVHTRLSEHIDGFGRIVYPGPTFPNNFSELEELKSGSFVLVDLDAQSGKTQTTFVELDAIPVHSYELDCTHLSAADVSEKLQNTVADFGGILTLRLFGKLKSGSAHEIDFKTLEASLLHCVGIIKKYL